MAVSVGAGTAVAVGEGTAVNVGEGVGGATVTLGGAGLAVGDSPAPRSGVGPGLAAHPDKTRAKTDRTLAPAQ